MLIERVKGILLNPKDTWPQIKDESISFSEVLTGYAMPLAAIPAVFGLLGYALIGMRLGFGHLVYRIPFGLALIWAIVYYILVLAGLYIQGIVINALAPSFGSKQNAVNAFKLAVYAYTPAFIAGILSIIPAIGILVFLLSLYGIYLLYLGIPVMMETPKEKVIGYLIITIIVMIIIYFVIGAIAGTVLTIGLRSILL